MKEELIPQSIPLSDTDLLMLISWKEDNMQKATEAFNLLYKRYAPYLHPISINVCRDIQKYYDTNLANLVTNNTFTTIWEHPEQWIEVIDSRPEGTDLTLTIKAALGRIAKAELYDNVLEAERMFKKGITTITYRSAQKKHLLPSPESEEMISEPEENKENTHSRSHQEMLEILAKAMSMLTMREQEILKTTMIFYQKGNQMPDEVIDMLCKRFEILPDNLRQIKSRAMRKLKVNKEVLLEHARTISQK